MVSRNPPGRLTGFACNRSRNPSKTCIYGPPVDPASRPRLAINRELPKSIFRCAYVHNAQKSKIHLAQHSRAPNPLESNDVVLRDQRRTFSLSPCSILPTARPAPSRRTRAHRVAVKHGRYSHSQAMARQGHPSINARIARRIDSGSLSHLAAIFAKSPSAFVDGAS